MRRLPARFNFALEREGYANWQAWYNRVREQMTVRLKRLADDPDDVDMSYYLFCISQYLSFSSILELALELQLAANPPSESDTLAIDNLCDYLYEDFPGDVATLLIDEINCYVVEMNAIYDLEFLKSRLEKNHYLSNVRDVETCDTVVVTFDTL